MWRIARQTTRTLVQCSKMTKPIKRQKHTPVIKTIVSPTATTITTIKNRGTNIAVNTPLTEPSAIFNERLVELPLIHIGDYVEAFRNGLYSGMVVGQKSQSGGLQRLTLLLRNGKTIETRSDNVAFCIKDFANSEHASQIATEPIDLKNVNAEGVLKNIPPVYNRAVQNYQRTISMAKGMAHQDLENMYKQFIQDNVTNKVTLNKLAAVAFKLQNKSPSALQRHVTFLHLASDNIRYEATRDVRGSDTWTLRSRKDSEMLTKIITSIRTRDASYTGFLDRAKSLITFYNSHADPALGTFSQTALDLAKGLTSKLTDTDKTFVNFVIDWIKSPKVAVDSPYEVFVPNMLKALKCYDDLFFDRSLAIQFLKEVGVFRPWDNVGLVEDGAVAGEFIWSPEARQSEKRMNEFSTLFLSGKMDTKDPCESIRHDFGNMRVYTIDDPSAKEIDDGVSVERVPGEKSTWLHVHIADPTAYISPRHELSSLMQQKVQTLYLPERHFPMLPQDLSSQKFSLGTTAHTNADGSQYALTFSTKLDANGNIVDYKIRPSLLKNVKKIYYDDLDKLLLPLSPPVYDPLVNINASFVHPSAASFALKDTTSAAKESTVTKDCEQDLLDIFSMANKHGDYRIKSGAILFSRPNPVVEILPEPLNLPQIQYDRSNYASSLPAIRIRLDKSGYSPARQMVAETMIMGGRIASRFAHENNVDIPFRTQSWKKSDSSESRALREQMLASRDPKTGLINMQDMVQYMSILPPTTVTTQPGLPHAIMGIKDGYTRATSPLRRYLDMIVHWQLKSRLLGESVAPFTKMQLNSLSASVLTREKQLSFLQNRSINFWVISLLDRFRQDGILQGMEWNCIVNLPSKMASTELGGTMEVATGTLLDLGIRGRIENLNRNVQVGEIVKVRVSSLEPLLGRINLALI